MPRQKATRKQRKHRPDFIFRFLDQEHRELVEKVAKDSGLSINAWIVTVTLAAARAAAKA